MFQAALYIAITLSILGFLYQVFSLVKKNRPFGEQQGSAGVTVQDFFLNTFFQIKLFRAGKTRWLIHCCVISGFLYLVIFHALDNVTSVWWFADYQSTLDPFQFLRNLAGFLVLAGCLGFLYRRLAFFKTLEKRKLLSKGLFSIFLILMVSVSGILLETVKILSEPVFTRMVEDYSDIDTPEDLEDLKAYWGNQYHTVFTETVAVTPEKLTRGKKLGDFFCMDCHSPVGSAFISGTLAGETKKTIGVWLIRHRMDTVLYTVHYFLSLLILAIWPFSRLLHIVLIPVVSGKKTVQKQQLHPDFGHIHAASLYACTNCGFCSDVCSVSPHFWVTGNLDSLPHSKIESVKHLLNHSAGPGALLRLQSGNADCTGCGRCTEICPSGIDLQQMWSILDHQLALKGYPDTYTFVQNISLKKWNESALKDEKKVMTKEETSRLVDDVRSFENCIQCTICTNVCPVVEYDTADNDMTPQQVLNLLRLGKKHLAAGTNMVWHCLTCFSCQEYCPQGIKVADIMLELRNHAHIRADAMRADTSALADKRDKT